MSDRVVEKKDLILIRPGIEDDRSFITSTWLKGLRYGNDWFELIEAPIYYENYHKVVEKILNNATIQVACLRESPDVILGYSVSRPQTLDFVYVKKAWRKIGIAKSLVPADVKFVSHVTDVGRSILKTKSGVSFNPFN